MSEIDPQLLAVAARYDEVFAAYQSQQISADIAAAQVSADVVVDAAGATWGLTPQRMWWTQGFDGQRIENADPTLFASHASIAAVPPSNSSGPMLPPLSGARPYQPHGSDGYPTGVAGQPLHPGELPPLPGMDVVDMGAHQTPPAYSSPDPDLYTGRTIGGDEPSTSKLGGLTGKIPDLSQALQKLPFSPRTLIVIIVAVVLVFIAFLARGGGDSSESAADDSNAPAADVPTDSPPPAAASGSTPSSSDVSRVVETIQAGRAGTVVSKQLGPMVSQAAWTGSDEVGLSVDVDTVSSSRDQQWRVLAPNDSVVATVSVRWVKDDGQWKIKRLPILPTNS